MNTHLRFDSECGNDVDLNKTVPGIITIANEGRIACWVVLILCHRVGTLC